VDEVGVLDGGEAVGNDKAGAVFHELVESLLDESFGLGVDGGGGFVEEEDGWIFEEGAGYRKALFFSAGELDAALADIGVEAFGEFFDEGGGAGSIEGFPKFGFAGIPFGHEEVFANGTVEEEGFLGNVADVFTQGCFRDLGEFVAVDFDGA